MSKKKTPFNSTSGLVYSTDPNFKLPYSEVEEQDTLPAAQQKIKIRLDTKHRAGKAVTLIEGFIGKQNDREELGKKIKTFCGTGGSVKEDEIIIQGDNRDKALQWLLKNRYSAAKKS